MTLINRFIVPLAILLSLLPAVLATGHSSRKCKSNEFYYDKKDTCLPNKAPSRNSDPPSVDSVLVL